MSTSTLSALNQHAAPVDAVVYSHGSEGCELIVVDAIKPAGCLNDAISDVVTFIAWLVLRVFAYPECDTSGTRCGSLVLYDGGQAGSRHSCLCEVQYIDIE